MVWFDFSLDLLLNDKYCRVKSFLLIRKSIEP